MNKTVVCIIWKLTSRIEVFRNLGKLYSIHSSDILGVSRYTLDRKDLFEGYQNESVIIKKFEVM